MNARIALTICLLAGGLSIESSTVQAADIVVRPPLVFDSGAGVPRVKPASRLMRYPFGLLRDDYTPYGMAGVPARLYFTTRERDIR